MKGQVAGALHRANDRIAELVDDDPTLSGTSTTATMALFDGEKLTFGHVGDSRAYLFRDGEIRQVTKDHTFVQSLIDEGRITEEESRTHPHRNLILKAIDGVHDIDADLFDLEIQQGDRLLFCSDGASGVLDDGRLADVLSMGTPDYAAVELVRASLEAGTTDNVTCVVADIVDEAEPPPATSSRCWSVPPPTSSGARTSRRCRTCSAATGPATPATRARPGRDPRRRRVRDRERPGRPRGGEVRAAATAPLRGGPPGARRRRRGGRGLDRRSGGVLLEPAAVLRRRPRRHRDDLPGRGRRHPRRQPVAAVRDHQRHPGRVEVHLLPGIRRPEDRGGVRGDEAVAVDQRQRALRAEREEVREALRHAKGGGCAAPTLLLSGIPNAGSSLSTSMTLVLARSSICSEPTTTVGCNRSSSGRAMREPVTVTVAMG